MRKIIIAGLAVLAMLGAVLVAVLGSATSPVKAATVATANAVTTASTSTHQFEYTGVSCVSANFCVAVGSQAASARSEVGGSRADSAQGQRVCGLRAVTCASAKSCVGVGTWFTGPADLGYYGIWNGSIWRGARVRPQPKAMPLSSPAAVLKDRQRTYYSNVVRLVIARCSVDYDGRLTAHLPAALRLLIVKADGSVLVHSDGGSYKPLNWMSPPCRLTEQPDKWTVTNKAGETLTITITETLSDTSVQLGIDPGLVKDGVESHLQELLAEQLHLLGDGYRLIRREYPTPIGPVDIMCRDADGSHVAVELKRHAGIDATEQLTRYLELLNRDPLLSPVRGVLAAQTIKLQARTLAEDRGIRCVVLDYDAMRGIEREGTLF